LLHTFLFTSNIGQPSVRNLARFLRCGFVSLAATFISLQRGLFGAGIREIYKYTYVTISARHKMDMYLCIGCKSYFLIVNFLLGGRLHRIF